MDTKILYAKLATVPLPIKTHLGSEETIDVLEKIEDQFHLPAGSLGATKLIQKLQIKDLDAAYFAGQLSLELNLDKDKAVLISESIEKSILAPIRKELSDYGINIDLLEKFQIPAIEQKVAEGGGPKMISGEATPDAPRPPISSQPLPPPVASRPVSQIFSQTASGMSFGATPLASNKNIPAPAPQPAKPAPNNGWSKQAPQQPVVQLGTIPPKVTPAAPAAPSTPKPAPQQQPQQPQSKTPQGGMKTMSEFERLDMMKKSGAPAPTSVPAPTATAPTPDKFKPPAATPSVPVKPVAAPPTPPGPAPIMLHQISNSIPAEKSTDFRFNTASQNQINATIPEKPAPLKPAVLEFGAASTPLAPAAQNAAPKVVHYSQYKTPVPAPSAPGNPAPRQISEITQPSSKLPGEKVIVKDFLEPQK